MIEVTTQKDARASRRHLHVVIEKPHWDLIDFYLRRNKGATITDVVRSLFNALVEQHQETS